MTEWWKSAFAGMSRRSPIFRGKVTYFHPDLYSSQRFTKGRYSVAVISVRLTVGLERRLYVPNQFQKRTLPAEEPPPNLSVSCMRERMALSLWRLNRSKKLHLISGFQRILSLGRASSSSIIHLR